jgi:glycosyltransferase involved in cell wall biosynthesis
MHILIITNRIPFPLKDGASIATYNLAKGAHQLGHQVTMLCMNPSRDPGDPKARELQEVADVISIDVDNKITMIGAALNLLATKPFHISRFQSSVFSDVLTDLLTKAEREGTFDLIVLDGLFVTQYAPVIRSKTQATLVYRAHNAEHLIWQGVAQQTRGLKGWYIERQARKLKKYEQHAIEQFDRVIALSESDANIFRTLGCTTPITVSPLGVEVPALIPDEAAEFPSLFFIGSLDWIPNQEGLRWFLDQVWPLVHKVHPDLQFHIAGKRAPDWIREIRLNGVNFVGEVEDAGAFMKSRGLMVIPLLSGSGMRIKILEGASLGKSMVTTSKGLEGIDFQHEREVLVADAPEEFAQAILKCVDHKTFYESLGRSAHASVQSKYENKTLIDQLLQATQ